MATRMLEKPLSLPNQLNIGETEQKTANVVFTGLGIADEAVEQGVYGLIDVDAVEGQSLPLEGVD